MGLQSGSQALVSAGEKQGLIWQSYAYAAAVTITESLTESLLGISELCGAGGLLAGIAKGGQVLRSTGEFCIVVLEESFEEIINVPLQGLAEKLLVNRDKAWLGDDGVFDARAMRGAGFYGMVLGMILGAVSSVNSAMIIAQDSDCPALASTVLNQEAHNSLDASQRPPILPPNATFAQIEQGRAEFFYQLDQKNKRLWQQAQATPIVQRSLPRIQELQEQQGAALLSDLQLNPDDVGLLRQANMTATINSQAGPVEVVNTKPYWQYQQRQALLEAREAQINAEAASSAASEQTANDQGRGIEAAPALVEQIVNGQNRGTEAVPALVEQTANSQGRGIEAAPALVEQIANGQNRGTEAVPALVEQIVNGQNRGTEAVPALVTEQGAGVTPNTQTPSAVAALTAPPRTNPLRTEASGNPEPGAAPAAQALSVADTLASLLPAGAGRSRAADTRAKTLADDLTPLLPAAAQGGKAADTQAATLADDLTSLLPAAAQGGKAADTQAATLADDLTLLLPGGAQGGKAGPGAVPGTQADADVLAALSALEQQSRASESQTDFGPRQPDLRLTDLLEQKDLVTAELAIQERAGNTAAATALRHRLQQHQQALQQYLYEQTVRVDQALGPQFSESEIAAATNSIEAFLHSDTNHSGLTFEDVLDDYAKLYTNLVKSNGRWNWKTSIPGSRILNNKQKRKILEIARLNGYIPRISVLKQTGMQYGKADFSTAELSIITLEVPSELWKNGNKTQFRYLNKRIGGKPEGTVWHHTEYPGVMELVPWGIHNITTHNGGRSPGQWAFIPKKGGKNGH